MNVPISGPKKELALKMGHSEFQCSTGWLERFKQRHSIVFRGVTGEEGSVSEVTRTVLSMLLSIL